MTLPQKELVVFKRKLRKELRPTPSINETFFKRSPTLSTKKKKLTSANLSKLGTINRFYSGAISLTKKGRPIYDRSPSR